MEPWYGEAASVVHQLSELAHIQMLRHQIAEAESANGDVLVIVRTDQGPDPVGYVDYRVNEPAPGWLTIGVIAIAAEHRGGGYGSESVRLLEERTPTRRFLANINPRNGLSLYFWLRLGYRPAGLKEIFWRAPDEGGIISMIRIP
jgi:RimJ/RimL family protein N-acetyltransferase